ncbi:MAG: TRL-like family protein [Planctomycetes bacterium]|nr:TRL-like family protein [Planctomycetota bacterium]
MAMSPTMGAVVTDTKGPVSGVDNNVGQSKTGEAECIGIVCVAIGDASIKAAMDKGGITKIHHVDHETMSVLGIYAKYKTIVYGE